MKKDFIRNENECDCDEDNNCGCTYPNNVEEYDCGCIQDEECKCILFDPHINQYYHDDSVCFCNIKGNCDCQEKQT